MRRKERPRPRYPAKKRFRALCRWCMRGYATAPLIDGKGVFECPQCGAAFTLEGDVKREGRGERRWGTWTGRP